MGILGHHSLEPFLEPIAIFDQFVAKDPQTLIMKEKVLSVSGDSFEVKLASGQSLLKVHGAWVSISGRKKVEDIHGKHLFDIVKEHLHLHTTYAIEDSHGKKVAEVKNSLACKFHLLSISAYPNISSEIGCHQAANYPSARLQSNCHFH